VFSSSQSASINRFRDILQGQFRKANSKRHRHKILVLGLGKVVSRRAFIEEINIKRTNRWS
jgi:transposase-like protein